VKRKEYFFAIVLRRGAENIGRNSLSFCLGIQ
jgi:hypothetical protein